MSTPIVTPYPNTEFEKRLHRFQRQRDLALRGLEKHRMSPALAEALRNEIRQALEADGKPFDINVAHRVYDLAIAAKDMCAAATAATGGVGDTVKLIADNGGPMETLGELEPGAPAVQAQASETFGARILRELMATLRPQSQQDPKQLVHALAEARRNGMTDVATELEIKLFGRALLSNKPIASAIDVPAGSYEHGFADGKAGRDRAHETPKYVEGYVDGIDSVVRTANPDPPLCEECVKDPDPRGGSACFRCREIRAHRVGTFRHVFTPRVSNYYVGPPQETCEWCAHDPRNTIHVEMPLAIDDYQKQSTGGLSLDEAERRYKENMGY